MTQRLSAPTGSFYHRFASRDVLLAELWIDAVLGFQVGMVAAMVEGSWLEVALHTPRWARRELDRACLLLLYHRADFVRGDWPEPLASKVTKQAATLETCISRCAKSGFNSNSIKARRQAAFVLFDVPLAAVKPHLERREKPPALVDDLILSAFHAIVPPT